MNWGSSAESPKTRRSLLTAWFRLSSNSTKVSAGHKRARRSSRVTTSPGCSTRAPGLPLHRGVQRELEVLRTLWAGEGLSDRFCTARPRLSPTQTCEKKFAGEIGQGHA